MLSTIWYIILTVVGFGILILVHEFGHFIAAKAIGVRVETFSMGLGPRLFGKKIGETDYCLSAIPWGGFVKLAGEQRDPNKEPAPHDFYGKPPGQRAIVFAAGTFMNGVIGILAFILAFAVGVPTSPPIIGDVTPGSPAWRAGLKENDRIVAVDGRTKHLDFGDVKIASLLSRRDKSIVLEAMRNGERKIFEVTPEYSETSGVPVMGISPKVTLQVEAVVAYKDDGRRIITNIETADLEPNERSPAINAGILPSDEIIEANGIPLESHRQLVEEILPESAGEPINILFRRNGETHETTIKPIANGPWLLGIVCRSTTISTIRSNSWAEKAGFRNGDTITKVQGEPAKALSQAQNIIDNTEESEKIIFTVNGGDPRELYTSRSEIDQLDDVMVFEQKNIISSLTDGFPAEAIGIQPGDLIIEVGGKPISTQGDVTEPVRASEGSPINIRWLRDGEEMSATARPKRMMELGLLFRPLEEDMKLGLWSATTVGTRKALRWIPRVFWTLQGLITGRIASRHLGGPIGIVSLTYRSAEAGYGTLLYFLGFISLNLAIFNLLPIPVLDGGHLLFTAIEKVKGSPVSERAQGIASYIGLAFLLLLMAYAAWNDIIRAIFGMEF